MQGIPLATSDAFFRTSLRKLLHMRRTMCIVIKNKIPKNKKLWKVQISDCSTQVVLKQKCLFLLSRFLSQFREILHFLENCPTSCIPRIPPNSVRFHQNNLNSREYCIYIKKFALLGASAFV
jgi:hypothetical protein